MIERSAQDSADMAAGRIWSEVGDRLLRGVAHTLSNRTHAVLAIGAALDETASPLVPMLREEAARLESAVRLLRLLARGETPYPEPMRAEDLVADACALHAQRTDVSEHPVTVDLGSDAPPIRVDPVAALHALLLLFDAVGAEDEGRLTVAGRPEDGQLRLDLSPGGAADARDAEPPATIHAAVAAAGHLLALDAGQVTHDRQTVTIRIPALGATR